MATCASSYSYAQQQNVVIDSIITCCGPNEPCITIDVKNPLNMVAGSNYTNVYSSVDGGYTWFSGTLASTLGVAGDPVVISDTNHSFYYFHMGSGFGDMVSQRMDNISTGIWTDGGYTGLDTPKSEDKPWAVFDVRSNNIYLTWSRYDRYGSLYPDDSTYILFAKSADRGDSWSPPVRLNNVAGDCSNSSGSAEGAMPCVGPEGEIFVAWALYDSIMFNRSYDGGVSWLSNEIYVASSPGGWYYEIPGLYRCNGLPFIACDNSNGPHKGTIYINWTDQRNGVNNTDVWLCRSVDSGNTWSTPFRVNNDTGARQQFMSSMSVDPVTGYLYVMFYDRRNYSDTSLSTDVYLAVSKDGAATFQNYQISSSPFTPRSNLFFGDYTYVSAYNNVVRPVWGRLDVTDSAAIIRTQKIVVALIDSTITGTSTPTIQRPSGYLQAHPNPFSGLTSFSYELPMAEAVSLFVTDIIGRKVIVIRDNDPMSAGIHTDPFDAAKYGLNPGIYLLNLRSKDFSQTIKIELAR